jgi:hypothetical protein
MALKIKPTPILTGKSAQRFERLIKVTAAQKESREQIEVYKVLAKKVLTKSKLNSTF